MTHWCVLFTENSAQSRLKKKKKKKEENAENVDAGSSVSKPRLRRSIIKRDNLFKRKNLANLQFFFFNFFLTEFFFILNI